MTTRWDELMHFLGLVLKVGAELAGSVNFHFLNAGAIEDVQTWEQVAPIAERGPAAFTPLYGAMKHVFAQWDPAKTDRKLITVIATDGRPSDVPPVSSRHYCSLQYPLRHIFYTRSSTARY